MLRDAKQYEWLHEFEFLFAGTTAPDAAAAKAAENRRRPEKCILYYEE